MKRIPGDTRVHNRSLVMRMLYRTPGMSRAAIARSTGLTRASVSDLIASLTEEGLVIESSPRSIEYAPVRPGKPGTPLAFNLEAFCMIGLDVSMASTVRAAVIDLSGSVISRVQLNTDGARGEDAVRFVRQAIDAALQQSTRPVLGIGIGTPGLIRPDGLVISAPNLGWTNLPLQQQMSSIYQVGVQVMNDADLAVQAERSWGKASSSSILIRIGAGVGAGIIINDRVVRGQHSMAGEIGHVVIATDGGPECACGRVGCLEAWLRVPRLRRQIAEAKTHADGANILAQAGYRLGIALAPVIGVLDLGEVILAGPPDLLDGGMVQEASTTLNHRSLTADNNGTEVRMTCLGEDIVLLGAAAHVMATKLGIW